MLQESDVLTVQGIPEPDYLRTWIERLHLAERIRPFEEDYGNAAGGAPRR